MYPTNHVQQDIHPTNNPPQSVPKSGAGEARRRVGRQGGSRAQTAKICVRWPSDGVLRTSTGPGTQSPWDSVLGAIDNSIVKPLQHHVCELWRGLLLMSVINGRADYHEYEFKLESQ